MQWAATSPCPQNCKNSVTAVAISRLTHTFSHCASQLVARRNSYTQLHICVKHNMATYHGLAPLDLSLKSTL